jgi:hypothetical protein
MSDKYKYAGDFDLWMRFFNHADLYNTETLLGSFRIGGKGQITRNFYPEYLSECDRIILEAKEKLTDSDKKILQRLKLYRKIQNRMPFLHKIFFKKIESGYFQNAYNVNFEVDSEVWVTHKSQ